MNRDPGAAAGEHRIPVESRTGTYEVRIGSGLLDGLGGHLASLAQPGPALVVTDAEVALHYLARVRRSLLDAGFHPEESVLSPGEGTKTLERVAGLYDRLLEIRADRSTPVVALGGGVVSDLAGFAAATWLRGIPWLAVPTSVLAQVDASIGGKTGVNLPAGKNLVGSFHPPIGVLTDVDVAATLGRRHYLGGLAEVVKAGLGLSVELFEALETDAAALRSRDGAALTRAVVAAVRQKARIVAADEREGDLRRVLNLGHTAGHAIEAATGYGPVLHGEAVAVGLLVAARISIGRGMLPESVVDRLDALLKALGLPRSLTDLAVRPDPERVEEHLARDKKRRGERIALVLPTGVGDSTVVPDGTAAEVLDALA